MADEIPVIDLFAGPGGLGEGFTSIRGPLNQRVFSIALSIEKDPVAHSTLQLRAFYRQFHHGLVPDIYYHHLQDRPGIDRNALWTACPRQATAAANEAWNATLGEIPPGEVDRRIDKALQGARSWVLIGGPPCQAYSLAGRSRVGGISPSDHRVYLYREYLRILARHAPSVFVMENVKGLLSARVNGERVFEWIRRDLQEPAAAVRLLHGRSAASRNVGYRLYSLVNAPDNFDLLGRRIPHDAEDFLIRCERHGIPQARHRIIIIGVRDDISTETPEPLAIAEPVTVGQTLRGLPRLRSGLSKEPDGSAEWMRTVRAFFDHVSAEDVRTSGGRDVYDRVRDVLGGLKPPKATHGGRGGAYLPFPSNGCVNPGWFHSERLQGVCNHESRGHIRSDLYRYLYSACFSEVHRESPDLGQFPKELLPDHRSALVGDQDQVYFADRFRVQVRDKPATTITSHISKDGHYYIHFDPTQCRSLTVREAARLQTFPDDYFFDGPRTEQYRQVGNAVPPLLAKQIAERVLGLLRR